MKENLRFKQSRMSYTSKQTKNRTAKISNKLYEMWLPKTMMRFVLSTIKIFS